MKSPAFLALCRTARAWGKSPGDYFEDLGTWERYCLDEAGAWLLSRKKPPRYGEKTSGSLPRMTREKAEELRKLGARVSV